MTRITVTPERLQELSVQFVHTRNDIQDIGDRLDSILGNLDWEVRQQEKVEGQVQSARQQARILAEQTEVLARHLAAKAQAFEQADQQGMAGFQVIFDKYPLPIPISAPESEGPIVSRPSLDTVFDMLNASLSTVSLFVINLGLDAVKVFVGAIDFFLRKLPNAEVAFLRWEDYNRQDNWDRATADQYQEEARKALEELGVSGLKDTLDLIADKIPESDAIDKALKKAYDAIGMAGDWIETLDTEK